MKTKLLYYLLILSVFLSRPCEAGTKIYYLRHAESGHNVIKAWALIPVDKRPVYVGHPAMFSPLGDAQAANVPNVLAPYKFDFIAVSPFWRTLHTILPYLKEQNRTAEIWPELVEFGSEDGDEALVGAKDLPPRSPDILTGGKKIELPADERRWFTFRPDGLTEPKLRRLGAEGAADITFILRRVLARLHADFAGSNKSILLVGHGTSGEHFLQMLTGDMEATKIGLKNTGLWMAEEQPDGRFKIMIVNGQPVSAAVK